MADKEDNTASMAERNSDDSNDGVESRRERDDGDDYMADNDGEDGREEKTAGGIAPRIQLPLNAARKTAEREAASAQKRKIVKQKTEVAWEWVRDGMDTIKDTYWEPASYVRLEKAMSSFAKAERHLRAIVQFNNNDDASEDSSEANSEDSDGVHDGNHDGDDEQSVDACV
jgi:hypothetical protein